MESTSNQKLVANSNIAYWLTERRVSTCCCLQPVTLHSPFIIQLTQSWLRRENAPSCLQGLQEGWGIVLEGCDGVVACMGYIYTGCAIFLCLTKARGSECAIFLCLTKARGSENIYPILLAKTAKKDGVAYCEEVTG